MSQPATPIPPPNAPHATGAAPRGDRGSLMMLLIAGAALLFIATGAVLFWRSATMVEPKCVLVVETSPALRGAQVKVDGLPLAKSLTVEVGRSGRYAIPFYLDPGTYHVEVTLAGEVQHRSEVTLTKRDPGLRIDLARLAPTTASTLPARPLSPL